VDQDGTAGAAAAWSVVPSMAPILVFGPRDNAGSGSGERVSLAPRRRPGLVF
jgi:hypothetical protein